MSSPLAFLRRNTSTSAHYKDIAHYLLSFNESTPLIEEFPFLHYAAEFCPDHAIALEGGQMQENDLLWRLFDPKSQLVEAGEEEHDQSSSKEESQLCGSSPLYGYSMVDRDEQ